MAKPVVVTHLGATSSFQLNKHERPKLYGVRRRIPVDSAGQACTRAGMTAQGWLDPDDRQVEGKAIGAEGSNGALLTQVRSTLGEPMDIEEPLPATDLPDLAVTLIYCLEPESFKEQAAPQQLVKSRPLARRRFLASGEVNNRGVCHAVHRQELGQAVIDAYPDVDLELVGRPIERTRTVCRHSNRKVLCFAQDFDEVLLDSFGQERERRSTEDSFPDVIDEAPVRFIKSWIKHLHAVHRFALNRTLQLCHINKLIYGFLHGVASELDETDEMVLLGTELTDKQADALITENIKKVLKEVAALKAQYESYLTKSVEERNPRRSRATKFLEEAQS